MDFLSPIPTNMDDAHGNQNIHLFGFARWGATKIILKTYNNCLGLCHWICEI
jgi:hypothetical protein